MSPSPRSLLAKALARRAALEREGTTAYRAFHGPAEGNGDVTVDRFDRVAVVSLYADWDPSQERAWVEATGAALGAQAVYLKRRPAQARVASTTRRAEVAPEGPALGAPIDSSIVAENHLRFSVRPAQGLSVGLYLDARDLRRWVHGHARGRTVLNCFAYTCGFGVAALTGGAARVVNLDLSRRVLDWGEDNYRLNGLQAARGDFVAAEALQWLRRGARSGGAFDWVILDPPSFSSSARGAFSVQRDYPSLVEAAVTRVAKGGALIACCNLAKASAAQFRKWSESGLAAAGRSATRVVPMEPSEVDFPRVRPFESSEGRTRVRPFESSEGRTVKGETGLKVLRYEGL